MLLPGDGKMGRDENGWMSSDKVGQHANIERHQEHFRGTRTSVSQSTISTRKLQGSIDGSLPLGQEWKVLTDQSLINSDRFRGQTAE